jgi:RNA polymerase-binding transcription factor DksA
MEQFVRTRLLQMQAEFRQRVGAIQQDMQSLAGGGFTRQAHNRESDEVLMHLLNEAEIELGRVNQALLRIQEGRYGQCVRCGEPISPARLVAVPQTDICHVCARYENQLAHPTHE